MKSTTKYKICRSILLIYSLILSGCGGGEGEKNASVVLISSAPSFPWPQPVVFTDFIGTQNYFELHTTHYSLSNKCLTCITVRGIARESRELGNLRSNLTPFYWPVPYNEKSYTELPIDYSRKIAVVLEDAAYHPSYKYSVEDVEETVDTILIKIRKCSVTLLLDGIMTDNAIELGLLLPKTDKSIQVLTVQTANPPAFGHEPIGIGGC